MSDTAALETAAIEAKMARERLIATSRELQSRLDPATLIEDARMTIRDRAAGAAEAIADAARRQPVIAAGIGAGVTLWLFRRRLRGLVRRRKETDGPHRR